MRGVGVVKYLLLLVPTVSGTGSNHLIYDSDVKGPDPSPGTGTGEVQ